MKDIRTLFNQEDDYCKPVKVGNFWNNNYIKYKSNNDRYKPLSIREYLNKIEPYLKNITIDLQTWVRGKFSSQSEL